MKWQWALPLWGALSGKQTDGKPPLSRVFSHSFPNDLRPGPLLVRKTDGSLHTTKQRAEQLPGPTHSGRCRT
jgi:hypothetical protein